MDNFACFIISTGRCGTQWLAQQLKQQLPAARVEHEPLAYDYDPIHNSPTSPLASNGKQIAQHLADIKSTLDAGKTYIETGFPCWRHIAWFKQQLDCEVKVIHLQRHPVNTALSWLTQGAFVPPLLPHLKEKRWFIPSAPLANLTEYQQHWQALSPFEKNLYFWAEVQLQALAYQQQWPEPAWLNLRFEDFFCSQSQALLTGYLVLSDNRFSNQVVDNYRSIPQYDFEPGQIQQHPKIAALAKQLGYSAQRLDKQALLDKYFYTATGKQGYIGKLTTSVIANI